MVYEREISLQELPAILRGMSVTRLLVEIIAHHTWIPTVLNYFNVGGLQCVRGVRRYHMNTRGWRHNGYHLMIGPDGRIFLCRPMGWSGGHCLGHNAHSIGVCLIGNYDLGHDTPVSQWEGYRTLVQVLALLCLRFKIPVERIYPHSRFAAKTCPGTGVSMQTLLGGVHQAMISHSGKPTVVQASTNAVVPCNARMEGNALRGDIRPLLEALGMRVVWHPEQGKAGKAYVVE